MYKYEDFKEIFNTNHGLKYLLDTVLNAQKQFSQKEYVTREELVGLGDSWSDLACIDRLEELGYIKCTSKTSISNYW